MEGIIRKISKVERQKKDGTKFSQVIFDVDVIIDSEKKVVKTRKATMSETYAKEYATHCGLSSKDMIGKKCNVVLEKRQFEKDGEERIYEYIKYLNIIDDEGEPIIIKKEESKVGF